MDRRTFLGAVTAPVVLPLVRQPARYPLPRVTERSGSSFSLHAREALVDFGPGTSALWTLEGTSPAPLLRLRRGQEVRIDLTNDLDEPTILHWHGLDVPEAADGHPRLAIGPGASYRYDFTVRDPAGLYWYHPHTHGRTAAQTYMGMAGLIVIEDEDEVVELPSGGRELPLIVQDRRLTDPSTITYAPRAMGPDRMYGFLGDRAFGNGVVDPTVTLARGVHRLRILNASNARVLDVGLSDGSALTLIGGDGGLLPSPTRVQRIMMGTGERVDLLIDLSEHRPGQRIKLESFPFDVPGMMGMMGGRMGRGRMGGRGMGMMGGLPQGAPLDLLEIVVGEERLDAPAPIPEQLRPMARPTIHNGTGHRTFRFQSMMMNHTINGRGFEMDRVDARIRLGEAEVWTLVNESGLPHPVHIHGGQHRVLARRGGRGAVMPWEAGLKDTVLLFPEEEVDMLVRFDHHPGRFLLHCHNLEHEDAGMMLNFEVVEWARRKVLTGDTRPVPTARRPFAGERSMGGSQPRNPVRPGRRRSTC